MSKFNFSRKVKLQKSNPKNTYNNTSYVTKHLTKEYNDTLHSIIYVKNNSILLDFISFTNVYNYMIPIFSPSKYF